MLLAIIKNLLGRKPSEPQTPSLLAEAVSLSELTDEDLMIRYSEGDVDAFGILLKRHEKPVFNFILRSCGRRDRAEELLQEVFLRVIKSADNYKTTAKFTTWLYTIARNLCIDSARKHGRYLEVSLDAPLSKDSDSRTMLDGLADENVNSAPVDHDRSEFRAQLAAALEEMPDDQREVFLMREVSGLKFREIAEILDCPVPTIKSRMRYALENLRGALAAYRDHSFDEEEQKETTPVI